LGGVGWGESKGKIETKIGFKTSPNRSHLKIASVLVLVVIQSMLTGCATIGKSSGVVTSREATEIWHSYEILANYHYYYAGPDAQPFRDMGHPPLED
jgi:hypothetical protein